MELAIPGSGLAAKIQDEFGYDTADFLKLNPNPPSERQQRRIQRFILRDLTKTLASITLLSQQHGQPLSASYVLTYYLHENSGSLDQAIWDTAIFLKALSRNNITSAGEFSGDDDRQRVTIPGDMHQTQLEHAVDQLILDEYSFIGTYHSTLKVDQGIFSTPPNRRPFTDELKYGDANGGPYHSWFDLAILSHFAPEVSAAGITLAQEGDFRNRQIQSYRKLAVDSAVSAQLAPLSRIFELIQESPSALNYLPFQEETEPLQQEEIPRIRLPSAPAPFAPTILQAP